MKTPSSYFIDHREYSPTGLLNFCRSEAASPECPPWKKESLRFIIDFLGPGNHILQKTSGTTGNPKRLNLKKSAMMKSAEKTIDFFNLKNGQTALLCLPVSYIAGKMMVVRSLSASMNLLLREPSGRPLRDLNDDVDFTAMVPLQLYESLIHNDPLKLVRKLIIGGGEINPTLRKMIDGIREAEIYESFATTETCSHIALKKLNGNQPDKAFQAMKDVEISQDDRGCLIINAPGITENPVITNDLVELEDGGRFNWLGRTDNLIKSGGKLIIPEQLEEIISPLIGFNCVIVAEPDISLGQKMVLVIEAGDQVTDTSVIKAQIKNALEPHFRPKQIVILKEFPRNKSFKYDRTLIVKSIQHQISSSI